MDERWNGEVSGKMLVEVFWGLDGFFFCFRVHGWCWVGDVFGVAWWAGVVVGLVGWVVLSGIV